MLLVLESCLEACLGGVSKHICWYGQKKVVSRKKWKYLSWCSICMTVFPDHGVIPIPFVPHPATDHAFSSASKLVLEYFGFCD